MAIVWPVTLPLRPLVEGYSDAAPNNVLRTSVDIGPAKTRRRSAAAPYPITANFVLTASQAADLDTFANTTLMGGALRFEWQHPRTGATIECRIVPSDKDLVKFTPEGPLRWRASMTLEVLP